MENNKVNKINFLKKIWYSLAKPSKYEEMRNEGVNSPGYFDQPGVFQLRQDPADDDGVGVDAARQEVAGNLVLIFEGLDAGEDMQRDGKSTGNLHKLTSRVCFYRVAGAFLRIYNTLI